MADSMGHSNTGRTSESAGNREAEFEALSKELAEKELELATLESRLSAFEKLYAGRVGVLIAELDALEKEIARELYRLHPEAEYQAGFGRAEKKAKASREAVDEKTKKAEKEPFIPSEELKNLYRRIAKTLHPDLAANDAERGLRTSLMAKANEAYKKGDKEALERIVYEWEHRGEQAARQAAPMVQTIPWEQRIRQIRMHIQDLERRIAALKQSDLCRLMLKTEQAGREGRDLLGGMAKDLQTQIQAARGLLENLRERKE
jgi:hypothetical protein